jgi:hypothetical protein
MLGFLRPTKWKIIGTVLILIADWVAGFVSGQIGQFAIPKETIAAMTPAFTEAFKSNLMALMVAGFIIIAVEFILKVVFFYTILSFVMDRQGK